MTDHLSNLLHLIATLTRACVVLTAVFVLALIAGALYILRALLPALLRAACVALFVFGWLQSVLSTHTLYAQVTDSIAALFVAAAVGVALLALPVIALRSHLHVWSAFALAGLVGFGCAWLCARAQSEVALQWIARGLPVSLAASGLIYFATTKKYRRIAREPQHAE